MLSKCYLTLVVHVHVYRSNESIILMASGTSSEERRGGGGGGRPNPPTRPVAKLNASCELCTVTSSF